jgi:glycopeptide antibiotics resistance protein
LLLTGFFVVVALPVAVLIALAWSWRRRDGWWLGIVRVALATYVVALVGLLFFPLPLPPWRVPEFDAGLLGSWPYPWANIVPFDTIGTALRLGPDWREFQLLLGNIAAFVPIGVFVGALRPGRHSWRRLLVTGLAISLIVELAQLGMSLLMGYPYRVADVDDVIVNVAGVLLGYGGFRIGDVVGRALLPARLVFWG